MVNLKHIFIYVYVCSILIYLNPKYMVVYLKCLIPNICFFFYESDILSLGDFLVFFNRKPVLRLANSRQHKFRGLISSCKSLSIVR